MSEINLFTNDAAAKVVKFECPFGIRFDVYSNGNVIYSSPFLDLARNFADEFNSVLQLE